MNLSKYDGNNEPLYTVAEMLCGGKNGKKSQKCNCTVFEIKKIILLSLFLLNCKYVVSQDIANKLLVGIDYSFVRNKDEALFIQDEQYIGIQIGTNISKNIYFSLVFDQLSMFYNKEKHFNYFFYGIAFNFNIFKAGNFELSLDNTWRLTNHRSMHLYPFYEKKASVAMAGLKPVLMYKIFDRNFVSYFSMGFYMSASISSESIKTSTKYIWQNYPFAGFRFKF